MTSKICSRLFSTQTRAFTLFAHHHTTTFPNPRSSTNSPPCRALTTSTTHATRRSMSCNPSSNLVILTGCSTARLPNVSARCLPCMLPAMVSDGLGATAMLAKLMLDQRLREIHMTIYCSQARQSTHRRARMRMNVRTRLLRSKLRR